MPAGTIVRSRTAGTVNVYGALQVRIAGRLAGTVAPTPLVQTGAIARMILAGMARDRAIAAPATGDLTTVVTLPCLSIPVTVRTLAADAADDLTLACVHSTTVRTLINRALDGDLTAGDKINDYHRPNGVRVIRRWNGATLERDYRYPVSKLEIDSYKRDDSLTGAVIREAEAAVKDGAERSDAIDAGTKPLTGAERAKRFRDKARNAKLAAADAALRANPAALLDTATAPTDGPVSRGENLVRPGSRHTGRHVPNQGR